MQFARSWQIGVGVNGIHGLKQTTPINLQCAKTWYCQRSGEDPPLHLSDLYGLHLLDNQDRDTAILHRGGLYINHRHVHRRYRLLCGLKHIVLGWHGCWCPIRQYVRFRGAEDGHDCDPRSHPTTSTLISTGTYALSSSVLSVLPPSTSTSVRMTTSEFAGFVFPSPICSFTNCMPPKNCGTCTINGDHVELLYWPVPASPTPNPRGVFTTGA
jgi:hypothetical protein